MYANGHLLHLLETRLTQPLHSPGKVARGPDSRCHPVKAVRGVEGWVSYLLSVHGATAVVPGTLL